MFDFFFLVCQVYGFTVGLGGMCSIGSMAAIAINRYQAIVKIYQHSSSARRDAVWITITWLYAAFWVGLPFFGFGSYVKNSYGIACTFEYIARDRGDTSFVVTLFVGGFIMPLTAIIYCYSAIFLKTFKNEINFMVKRSHADFRAEGRRRADIKVAKVSVIVVVLFCASWLPFAIITLLGAFGHYSLITPQVDITLEFIGKASVIISPIVYSFGHPVLRKSCLKCLRVSDSRVTSPLETEDFSLKSTVKVSLLLKN